MMKFRSFFISILTFITGFLFSTIALVFPMQTFAVYDPISVPNNKYGIHILDTSEINKAAEFVNSGGGQWGYVTIPIRANDRDLIKWTDFMKKSRELKVIPVLRIASFPVEDHWMAPNEYDLVDFSNFLDELPWPVKNRYVVVYNEPNHEGEWGGFVNPFEYARVLDRAIDIFHKKSSDYFIISAGMDSSAPNGDNSMDEYLYFKKMEEDWPGILGRADGFSSHAYGNPAFSTWPNVYSRVNIASYRFETEYLNKLGIEKPKLFITEAGWREDIIGDYAMETFFKMAFSEVWTEENIVTITPFLLNAQQGAFTGFSFMDTNGSWKNFARKIMETPKVKGNPELSDISKEEVKQFVNSSSLPIITKDLEKIDLLNNFVSIFQRIKTFFDSVLYWSL